MAQTTKEKIVKELCEMGKLGMLPKVFHPIFKFVEVTDWDAENFGCMSISEMADYAIQHG